MIPADKIIENQYTKGNEFVYIQTGKYYQGYYCIVSNSKYYTGKTYTSQSQELSKTQVNSDTTSITSLPPQQNSTRYFIKKTTQFPIIIKEVSKQTYDAYQTDPIYQTLSLVTFGSDFDDTKTLEQAEMQMPGIKAFLLG